MSPFEWAMVIMSAISTTSALTAETDIDEENPVAAAGAGAPDITPVIGGGSIPTGALADLPTLQAPTKSAAAAAAATPQVPVTPPPQLEGPPAQTAPTRPVGPEVLPPPPPLVEQPPADIGKILAAIPDALAAVAPLLGLTNQPLGRQTLAPAAGGQPGQPVGQFAQTFGGSRPDIGQLLAALPGIRG